MPFVQEYVDPEEYFTYKDKVIYHAYGDQNAEDKLHYHFSTSDNDNDEDYMNFQFDIRDIGRQIATVEKAEWLPEIVESDEGAKSILQKAIDLELLEFPEDK